MVSPIPKPMSSRKISSSGSGVAGVTVPSSASPAVASAVPMIGKTRYRPVRLISCPETIMVMITPAIRQVITVPARVEEAPVAICR